MHIHKYLSYNSRKKNERTGTSIEQHLTSSFGKSFHSLRTFQLNVNVSMLRNYFFQNL